MEKYDQATPAVRPLCSGQQKLDLICVTVQPIFLLFIINPKSTRGFDLLSTFCSAGLHGAYAVRLLSSVIEAE